VNGNFRVLFFIVTLYVITISTWFWIWFFLVQRNLYPSCWVLLSWRCYLPFLPM